MRTELYNLPRGKRKGIELYRRRRVRTILRKTTSNQTTTHYEYREYTEGDPCPVPLKYLKNTPRQAEQCPCATTLVAFASAGLRLRTSAGTREQALGPRHFNCTAVKYVSSTQTALHRNVVINNDHHHTRSLRSVNIQYANKQPPVARSTKHAQVSRRLRIEKCPCSADPPTVSLSSTTSTVSDTCITDINSRVPQLL